MIGSNGGGCGPRGRAGEATGLRHLVVALKIMANASWTSLFVLPLLRLLTIEAFRGTGERTRIKISNGTRADEASRGVNTAQTENQSNEKQQTTESRGSPYKPGTPVYSTAAEHGNSSAGKIQDQPKNFYKKLECSICALIA